MIPKKVFQGTRPDTWTGRNIARDLLDGTRCPRRGREGGLGVVVRGGTGLQRETVPWYSLSLFPRSWLGVVMPPGYDLAGTPRERGPPSQSRSPAAPLHPLDTGKGVAL